MKTLMKAYGLTCVLMMAAFGASATTIILPSDEQLIQKSPVIVTGSVLSSAAVERDGRIWTETVVSVARAIKGDVGQTLTVREIGGESGDRLTKIFGSPEFSPGESVLLFLDRDGQGAFRTVDLFIGKFRHGMTVGGRRLWLREETLDEVSLLDENLREIEARNVQRDATGFETFVADRVKGRPGIRNYGVENPVLAEDVQPAGRGITSNFTLISEPTVYRWTRFDSGQSALWYSSGAQPGYPDGGVSELQTAMASWTGYAAAKIHYSYAGARSGSLGGLNGPNGVNEVLFNDPLNEVSGTFTGSGVVGIGGFNGTSGSTNWTAPFAADGSHTAGTRRVTTITEGNLTIQDGVMASGISSSRLAEIIAHEFGHTLGFGHSADGTALMYNTVTGRGPALRADDQTAARWLYPNGSATPPPPPPPPPPPALSASFAFSPSNPTTSTTVAFSDQSAGGPTSWSWSFGDGSTSTAQNPSKRYSSAGSYTVSLTVSHGSDSKTTSRTVTVTNPAVSPVPAYQTLVSAAAQTDGVGGTVWRTELTIFNAGSQSASIDLLFLPVSGGSVLSRPVYLAPRQTVIYENALVDLFSIASGSGAIAINATSAGTTPELRVTNRTYTNGVRGTYGQSVPSVTPSGLERVFYLTAMQANARYRTNVGLVNRSAAPVPLSMTLHDWTGATIATKSMTLAASTFLQSGLTQLFPEIGSRSYDLLSMRLNAAADDAVSAYASVIDNESQDPIYVQARPAAVGSELTIPIVGRAPGANGTFWRTDVTLFNPGPSLLSLSLRYEGSTRSLALDAGDTVVLADVVSSQFGRSSGTAALNVSWGGSAGPVVTSRTYTSTSTNATFGQSIDPVDSFSSSAFVTGLRGDGAYRSNVGFVNGGGESETFTVILLSAYGSELGRKSLTLAAGAQTQFALPALFPGASSTAFTLQVAGDSNARLFVYGSMVDNLSGDPVFFAGQ